MDAFCRNNIGEIALEQGHLDEAEALFEVAGRIWRAAGYRSVAGTAMCNFGRVALARGDVAEAGRLFEGALAEAQHVGGHAEMLEVASRLAECRLAAGDVAEALELADASLQRCRALGGLPAQVALLQRVRGLALWALGRTAEVGAALDASLAAARAREADYETALTLGALARWRRHQGEEDVTPLEAERIRIFERLGVVWAPERAADPPEAGWRR